VFVRARPCSSVFVRVQPIFMLAALLALLLCPSGCGPASRQNYLRLPYQGRPEYAPPRMSLQEKAELFQKQLDQDHVSPLGLMIYLRRRDGPDTLSPSYQNLNDTPIWGGIHLAQESFRYAVTGSPEALESVRRSIQGLHLLQAVHGVPGLLARHIAPRTDPGIDFSQPDTSWRDAAPAFPDLKWKCNVSKDQYSGMIFGYAVAYDLVPDQAVRAQIRRDMTAIADFLVKNRYRIVDYDGKRTKYSNLRARIGPVPIGVQALISLAAIKAAHHVSGEPRFEQEYRRLVRRRWPQATWLAKFRLFGKTNQNNDNMAFLSYYSLLRLEKDPNIRRHYQHSADRSWRYVRHEGNAFWNLIYLGTGGRDIISLEETLLQLHNFPATKATYRVDLRGRTDIERAWLKNRKGLPQSQYPLPINLRSRSSFDWKECPYALVSGAQEKFPRQYVPTDYLVCYWMGRYHQLLGPDD